MLLKKISLGLALVFVLSGCTSKSNIKANIDDSANHGQTVSKSSDSLNKTNSNNDADKVTTPNASETSAITDKPFTSVVVANKSELQTKKITWSWLYSPKENGKLLSEYYGYAFGDSNAKVIYLTFDEGYENGYTGSILDTLKANNVHAAFFVTDPYVTGSFNGVKDLYLVKRMSNEGHLICNHSVHHLSMPSFIDETKFDSELTGVQSRIDSIPGLKMSKFFRPPMGDFSELSLYYTQKLGYKTIFFALGYSDWDTKNQPDPVSAKKILLKDTKPGMICLLHPESKTNAAILDSLIKEWKSQGYEFKTLNELP